ncbi:MAG TPA: ComEC/Rec2 family competence protein [Clostridia bacterium]|nr:ComEC/Rec2 family competence protein [Clostridia bacterium]
MSLRNKQTAFRGNLSWSHLFFRKHYEHLIELSIVPIIGSLWACSAVSVDLVKITIVLCSIFIAAVAIVCSNRCSEVVRSTAKVLLWISVVCALCIRIPFALQKSQQFWGLPAARVTEISGTVLDDSRMDGRGGSSVKIALTEVKDNFGNAAEARGSLLLLLADSTVFYQGQKLRVPVQLKKLENTMSTQVLRVSYLGKAHGQVAFKGYASVLPAKRAALFASLRARLVSIGRYSPPLLEALLLGYKDGSSGRLFALFRQAGCAHLLALSGMHLGVISLGVLVCSSPLIGRRRAVLLSLLTIVFYLFLVGIRPSMLRAVIMYALGSAGVLLMGARVNPFHILCMTFITQSLLLPQDSYSLGFQLSYVALCGICLWTRSISRCLPVLIPPLMRDVVAATIAAQCCSACVLVKSFGVLYPIGLLAPLLLTPLVTLWMWGGLAYLLWSCFLNLVSGPLLVMADRYSRLLIERAAFVTVDAVRWWSLFSPIEISPDKWRLTALIAAFVLTLFSLCQYAGCYGWRVKLQFSQIDRPVSANSWNGPKPPVWAEFSDFPSGTQEDSQAA